jgi:hypothetical protein
MQEKGGIPRQRKAKQRQGKRVPTSIPIKAWPRPGAPVVYSAICNDPTHPNQSHWNYSIFTDFCHGLAFALEKRAIEPFPIGSSTHLSPLAAGHPAPLQEAARFLSI